MSIPIPAIMRNRRWRKWLTEHCPKHQLLLNGEIVHIDEQLSSPAHKSGNALSFEVENVHAETMSSCVVNVLLELSINTIVVWVGSYMNPVVARVSVARDLKAIFDEAAIREEGVPLASEHVAGRADVHLPLSGEPGEFFCSGTGPFEDAVKRIAQLYPDGVLFRGN